jgi:hypothetical protein
MENLDMDKIMEMLKTMLADDHKKMMARMDVMQKKMMARMDAWLTDTNNNREKMLACQEKAEVRLEEEEPASVEMKPEMAHEQEVLREDAATMPVEEPRKRRRDRNLDARRSRKQQERIQNKDGCRKNSVAAHRGTTRRAKVARRKENLIGKIGPGTTWYEGPQNDGRSGGNVGRHRKTKMD